jgi:membrane protease YdiL (CAAX protease family)
MESLDSPLLEQSAAPGRIVGRSFFRDVPWRWSDVFIGLAPEILVYSAPWLLGPLWFSTARSGGWLPFVAASQGWMLAYPLWTARRRHARWPHFPRARAFLLEALLELPVLVAVMAASALILNVLGHLFGEGNGDVPTVPWEPVMRSANRFEPIALAILAVSVAPLAEEAFFRGMIYNALRQRLHPILAAVLQSAIFGFVHLPLGLVAATTIAVVGMALVAVYDWRKTLLAPVVLHALVNAVGVGIIASSIAASPDAPLLGVSGTAQTGGCCITEMQPGSAASEAGLQVGDLVTTVDSKPVVNIRGIAQIIRRKRVGESVSVEFIRDGKPYTVEPILKRWRQ